MRHQLVFVIAMRIPINLVDILSLAQASSSQGVDNDMMTEDLGFNEDSIFPSEGFNPFSLLSSIQIASSSLTSADWSIPQTVTMNLVGGSNNYEQQQQYYSITHLLLICYLFQLFHILEATIIAHCHKNKV